MHIHFGLYHRDLLVYGILDHTVSNFLGGLYNYIITLISALLSPISCYCLTTEHIYLRLNFVDKQKISIKSLVLFVCLILNHFRLHELKKWVLYNIEIVRQNVLCLCNITWQMSNCLLNTDYLQISHYLPRQRSRS